MADQNSLMKFHSSILQVASIIKNNEQKRAEDSFEIDKKKRERKANYTREETDRLVALIICRKDILENKKNGSNQWQEKKQAWEEIEREFNYKSDSSNYRDIKTLRTKYESLKRDIKRKWSIIQGKRRDANGKLPKLSAAEKKMKEIMQLPIEEGFCDFSSMNDKSDFDDDDSNDSKARDDVSESQSMSDHEPPSKRICGRRSAKHENEKISDATIEFQSISEPLTKETHEDPLIPIQSVQNERYDEYDTNIKAEKIEAAKLQTELLRHEIEIKKLQRKLLEEDLLHKRTIHELEKKHLFLKIEALTK